MPADREKFYTTEQVAEILGLGPKGKWRVIKFVESKEYGIKPAFVAGSGLGSRRMYDAENVYQIGLALRLLEAGLRPRVVGQALAMFESPTLSRNEYEKSSFIILTLKPQIGKLLDVSRFQFTAFVHDMSQAGHLLKDIHNFSKDWPNSDVLLVAVGSYFMNIGLRLELLNKKRED